MGWAIASMLLLVLPWAAVGRSLESGTWEGFVTFGRGASSFRPCGSRKNWWIKNKGFDTTADELQRQYEQIAERPYEQVYVRISGEISRKGQYGRLGSYQRVLYVGEILEIRAKEDGDCE